MCDPFVQGAGRGPGGRGTRNSSYHTPSGPRVPGPRVPSASPSSANSTAGHATQPGSGMQRLTNLQQQKLDGKSSSPGPTTPSTAPHAAPRSWAALLSGNASPAIPAKEETKPAQIVSPEPASQQETTKPVEPVKQQEQPAPVEQPSPPVAASSPAAAIAPISVAVAAAPAVKVSSQSPPPPLRPAPWAKVAAAPVSSPSPARTSQSPAAAPISENMEKEKEKQPAGPPSPTITPAEKAEGTSSSSLPTSPRSFSFQRANGVVITHEAPAVEHHIHYHSPTGTQQPGTAVPQQSSSSPSTEDAPAPAAVTATAVPSLPALESATAAAAPVAKPVLSWAEKARLAAAQAPPPAHKPSPVHKTAPAPSPRRGGNEHPSGKRQGGAHVQTPRGQQPGSRTPRPSGPPHGNNNNNRPRGQQQQHQKPPSTKLDSKPSPTQTSLVTAAAAAAVGASVAVNAAAVASKPKNHANADEEAKSIITRPAVPVVQAEADAVPTSMSVLSPPGSSHMESSSSQEPSSPQSHHHFITTSSASSAAMELPPLEPASESEKEEEKEKEKEESNQTTDTDATTIVQAPSNAGTTPAAASASASVIPGSIDLDTLCDSVASWRLSSNYEPQRVHPRGIMNPGNLCFVNAVLQALVGSSNFCRLVLALQTVEPFLEQKTYPVLSAMAAVAAEFQKRPAVTVVGKNNDSDKSGKGGKKSTPGGKDAASGNSTAGDDRKAEVVVVLGGKPVPCSLIMDLIRRFSPRQGSRGEGQVEQEDAHEFLHFLLDKMHVELLALRKQQTAARGEHAHSDGGGGHSEGVAGDQEDGEEDGWLVKSGKRAVRQQEVSAAPSEEASAVTALFQGKLATSVACKGAPNSVTVHPFEILEVPIFDDSIRCIDDALEALTAPETLDDYKPSANSEPQQAVKTERFQQLPDILVLHLMRFQFTGRSAKVNKFVGFDTHLQMRSAWLASGSTDRGAVFDLVATVTHHGKSISSGHYTADVVQPDGKWLRFDDSEVFWVQQQQVLAERPYLLVYQRHRR